MANLDDIRKLVEKEHRMLRHTDDTATKIEHLTGYSLDQLLEKFAAGWTLEPPKELYKFSDLLRDFG